MGMIYRKPLPLQPSEGSALPLPMMHFNLRVMGGYPVPDVYRLIILQVKLWFVQFCSVSSSKCTVPPHMWKSLRTGISITQ